MDNIRRSLVIEASEYADGDKSGPRSWEESFLYFLAKEGFVIAQNPDTLHQHRVIDSATTSPPAIRL
jgi:hypothetical protein